ncbi:MAG: hypothetical protein ACR2RE_30485 [Geminicoccaceae bacterium]
MPEFILDRGGPESAKHFATLSPFTQGYIEAALFCGVETCSDTDKSDEFGFGDLATDAVKAIIADCEAFETANEADLEAIDGAAWGGHGKYDREAAGRDYWFTRNGHGAGYWSRGFEGDAAGVAERLDQAASEAGESYLYLGDDGRVWVFPCDSIVDRK